MPPHPELIEQNSQFEKQVIELAPNVYGAVGFAASNVYMLIGDDGLVIIDTTETTKAAENIFTEFRKVTDKPVKTIIYTHSHRDHISGATVFAEGVDPEIIAHDGFKSDIVDVDTSRPTPNKAMMARTKRQFGFGLSNPDERVNLGVGPGNRPLEGMGAGYIPPTTLIAEERSKISRCRLELELVKAPGETPDHLVIWFADKRILFCGDNYYSSFPNLYAIRGTPYRDYDAWADTIDLLLEFEPDVLATGHTMPVTNSSRIREVLTDYRDAIRHVVSETVNGMNVGLDPVTIAANLRLPANLAEKPYLKEFYGHIGYASRAYFAGTMGWFDGNPTSLRRLPPAEEASKFIALAGGASQVVNAGNSALESSEAQWAMELADRLIAAQTEIAAAQGIKVKAMRLLADQTVNAPTRNYYLLSAYELERGE
ncbi:MAG: alkyl/aryl-sulfatase [Pseudomonadota bacterium]